MKNLDIKEIMVSDKMVTSSGILYKVTFYNKSIVNDFEEKSVALEVVVSENKDGILSLVDEFSDDTASEIIKTLKDVNKSEYEVHYFDGDKKNFYKERVIGLKNILNLNTSNNIVDITLIDCEWFKVKRMSFKDILFFE